MEENTPAPPPRQHHGAPRQQPAPGTTEAAGWFEGAVIYGVIPRLFGATGLRGVTARLADLQDLGVDALWLSPIAASPPGDFGYAVVDYLTVNPAVGTTDDLADLVRQAHDRGIRVLMDIVPNHTSVEHPWFQDARERGRDSPFYDFYDRDSTGEPTHYFNWTHLPNLNYDNPTVRELMLEAFTFWIREVDIDGFRVDAAWGIKRRAPDFWPRWRDELTRLKPDLLLLAEASACDPYYIANGFDATYDWTDELGHWAWEDVFTERESIAPRLRAALTAGRDDSSPRDLVFRFLNNNDTGPRFITVHGPELTRVAATLLLTLPGLPCVYAGDEIGAAYAPYQDPPPLSWDEDPFDLRPFYGALIALRRRLPSLRSRSWVMLPVDPGGQALAYLRTGIPGDRPVLVVLNFGPWPVEASVTLPPEVLPLFAGGTIDLLTGEPVRPDAERGWPVPLPRWGVHLLTPADG